MSIHLSRGNKIELKNTIEQQGIQSGFSKIVVGIGWDALDLGDDFELDTSVFLTQSNSKVSSDDDFIFYGNLEHKSGAVIHKGSGFADNTKQDKTQIIIDIEKLPADVSKLVFSNTIYNTNESNICFKEISNLYIRLLTMDHIEILRYDIEDGFSKETAIVMAEIYKHNGNWKFNAIGSGFDNGLLALCDTYGVDTSGTTEDTSTPVKKMVNSEAVVTKSESEYSDNIVSLIKKISDTPSGISLKKNIVNLEKVISQTNLTNHKARVVVAMDYSGSMAMLYLTGKVQNMFNRIMPLSLRFDDDGELDVWLFHNGCMHINSMNLNNYENFVQDSILPKYKFGGTIYSTVLTNIMRSYYGFDVFNEKQNGKKNVDKNNPVFIIFVTDGDNANGDKALTDAIIRHSSYYNIFIQFVGIGNEKFGYLKRLDDLNKRNCDNTCFINVEDIEKFTDDELYKLLLKDYTLWLQN